MRKALLLFMMTVALAGATHAQWTSLPYLITGTDTASSVYHFTGGGSLLYACTNKGLFASNNDGDTWTNLTYTKANTQNLAIRSVYADSATGKLFAGGDSALFVSSDNGATWSTTSISHIARINDITRAGANLLIASGAFGPGAVYYSSNDFASSTLSSMDSIPMDDFEVWSTDVYVSGKNGVYKSSDNGVTWGPHGTGFPVQCRFFFLTRSGSTLFAGDVNGSGLFKSTDNGGSWANTNSTVFNGFCQVFSVTSAHGSIVATMDGACNVSEPIKTSTDDGVSWSPFMTGLVPHFYPVVGRNSSGSCFFTFENNTRVPHKICTLTGIDDTPASLASVWLSPNPATTTLTIHAADSRSSQVKIVNITGQLVYENTLTSRDKTNVDIAAFPAGVYVVQVMTEASSYTLKFIKK